MPDSTNARWDADQQGWDGGTHPKSAGGATPNQLNISTLTLVPLVILLIVVAVAAAVGIHGEATTKNGTSTESSSSSAEEEKESSAEESPGAGEPSDEEARVPDEPEDLEDEDLEPVGVEAYERYEFGEFVLDVPEGWQPEEAEASVLFSSPEGTNTIEVTNFHDEYKSPWRAMEDLKSDLRAEHADWDYGVHRDQQVPDEESPTMELIYGLDGWYLYVRTFLGEDQKIYMISAAGLDADRGLTEEHYQRAVDSFCVIEYACL